MTTTPLTSTEKGWFKLAGTEKAGTKGSPGVLASLTTAMAGSNNDLLITARKAGTAGNNRKVQWANVGGFSMPLKIFEGGVPARITISPGSGTDMLFLAKNPGTAGNNITVTLVNTTTPSQALTVTVSGTAITVNLALDAGTAQIETATAAGTLSGASGNVAVVITSAILTGSPLTVQVATTTGDTAAVWAGKVRTALGLVAAITDKFTVGGSTTTISLTVKAAYVRANDATLNISLDNGTSTGVTTVATSANTTAGVAPAVTSTAALVIAAVNASTAAAALVDAYITETSSGAVAAVSATNLASGTDDSYLTYASLATDGSGAISTTGTLLAASLKNEYIDSRVVSADTGAGIVAALTATNLAGGLDAFGNPAKIQETENLQTVQERAGGQDRRTQDTLQPQSTRTGNNRLLRSVTAQDAAISGASNINITKSHGPRSPFL